MLKTLIISASIGTVLVIFLTGVTRAKDIENRNAEWPFRKTFVINKYIHRMVFSILCNFSENNFVSLYIS